MSSQFCVTYSFKKYLLSTCHLAITMKGDLKAYEKYRKWSLYSWGDDINWIYIIYYIILYYIIYTFIHIYGVVPEQEKRLWDGIAKEGLHVRNITWACLQE